MILRSVAACPSYVTKFCPKNMLCSKAPSLHCCQASLLFWTWWKIVKCVRKGGKSITVCPAITILLGAKSDFVTMLFGRRLKETDCLLLAFSAATIFPCHHLQPIFVLENAHFISAFYKCSTCALESGNFSNSLYIV